MRTLPGAAGSLMAALCLTACEATAPNVDAGGDRTQAPTIAAAPAQLTFRIYAFDPGRDPPAQILQVSNAGAGSLDWSADAHTSWITLWRSGAPGRLVVGLDRTHIHFDALDRPPMLRTNITLSAAGASNSPVQIPVRVLISYLPPGKL